MRRSPRLKLQSRFEQRRNSGERPPFFKKRVVFSTSCRNDDTVKGFKKNFFKADSVVPLDPLVGRDWAVNQRYSMTRVAAEASYEK